MRNANCGFGLISCRVEEEIGWSWALSFAGPVGSKTTLHALAQERFADQQVH